MSKTISYESRQVGEIYFNIIKIINENQKNEWMSYADEAGFVYASGGIGTFKKCLSFYNNPGTEVWVAYAADKPIVDPQVIDKKGIEMYMSVTTSEHAPFTTHMGIQRVPSENPHKNIAVLLHEFSANIMHQYHPNKLFILSTPQEEMRDKLFSSIKSAGKGDALYIYDSNLHDSDTIIRFIEFRQSGVKSIQDAGRKPPLKLLSELHLWEDLFAQRTKIESGTLFPHITVNEQYTLVTINDKHNGNNIARIESSDQEFDWVFNNYDLFQLGFLYYTPIVSVDLVELSNLFNVQENSQSNSEVVAALGDIMPSNVLSLIHDYY